MVWLKRATQAVRPWFRRRGAALPRRLIVIVDQIDPDHVAGAERVRRLGLYVQNELREGVVYISRPHLRTAAAALETLLHELAHAAIAPGDHGPEWQALTRSLGVVESWPVRLAELPPHHQRLLYRLGPYPSS